jgi:hypothetical protein
MKLPPLGLILATALSLATANWGIQSLEARAAGAWHAGLAVSVPRLAEVKPCLQCSTWTEETWQGEEHWTNTYHSLNTEGEECGTWNYTGGGSLVSNAPGQTGNSLGVRLASAGGSSGCVRCGGTSQCHSDAQEGPCHVPCNGGVSNDAVEAVKRAVRMADASEVQRLMLEGNLQFNEARQSLQVLRVCDPGLVDRNVDLDSETARRLAVLLDDQLR